MKLKLAAVLAGAVLAHPLAAQRLGVTAENPLAVERRDEVIAVPWSDVTRTLQSASPARVRAAEVGGSVLASQVIDNDGDGKPDELLFLANFWPKEKKTFAITADAPSQKVQPRVFIRHDDPRDDGPDPARRAPGRACGCSRRLRTSSPGWWSPCRGRR